MSQSLTGYGPRKRIYFDGDQEKYEMFEVKFKAHLRLQKLNDVIERVDDGEAGPSRNADVFAELVQVLDDKSLQLIMRDARDDGRKALSILREHYCGKSKPRILTLYTELTSLRLLSGESVTDYMLRAESTVTSLKSAGEVISDSLLIAMILKGLPASFSAFATVINQKDDDQRFIDFKTSLRSFEESENCRAAHTTENENVLKVMSKESKGIKCFSCGKMGHKSSQCYNKSNSKNMWCNICKSKSHDYKNCRKKKSSVQTVSSQSSNHSRSDEYCFKITYTDDCNLENSSCNLLVDCGATTHIVHDQSKFISFDKNFDKSRHVIELADGSRANNIVAGKGNASLCLTDSSGLERNITLTDALFIPSFKQDIFSVQAAVDHGAKVNFEQNSASLLCADGNKFNIKRNGKLYFLNNVKLQRSCSLYEWHNIMGHCNYDDIIKMESSVVGMKISDKSKPTCETCLEGKMTMSRNKLPDARAKLPMELIHCDLAGPMSIESREKSRYAIVFVDDYTGYVFVYFLKNKSDTINAMKKFLADTAQYGKIKRFRSDNGTEFTSENVKNLLIENQIKCEYTAPYSAHQNGTAERMWRTLFEMGRCLLLRAKLPKFLWNYSIVAAAYIRNRCFSGRINSTPYEMINKRKPNVSNMYTFGSECYAYCDFKKKLDPRSEKGIFLGYDPLSPAYLVYFQSKNVVKRSRIVKFLDDPELIDYDSEDDYYMYGKLKENPIINNNDSKNENVITNSDNSDKPSVSDSVDKNIDNKNDSEINESDERRYPRRKTRKPKYLEDYETDTLGSSIDYCYNIREVPNSYNEAMKSNESTKWKIAMDNEMQALKNNNTYDVCEVPNNRTVVGGRWVYAVKEGPGNEEKFKARYVAKGYSQVENVDYNETFSPTARMTSVRILMQLAAQEDLNVHQMDVTAAYLNADIDCEIYVEQPDGYCEFNSDGKKLTWKLNKSLYGLKQSGRNWNFVLRDFLLENNFIQSMNDNCVFVKEIGLDKIYIIFWVDDIIIAAKSLNFISDVKYLLNNRFQMKDLGRISWFLGIKFEFQSGCIKMNQSKYINKLLNRFKMSDCNPRTLPCDISINKSNFEDSKELVDCKLYREIVGSLIYVMVCTRPDLSYVITKLSQKMSNPTLAYLNIGKNVLRYLKGTVNYSLVFNKSDDQLKLFGYCDSDWGGSEDRKSLSGFCFQLNQISSPVTWKCRKQSTVALSSCEAEYVSFTYAIQEANFLRQLSIDILGNDYSVELFVDNQGAINLAKNPVHHQRSKHIDIKYHYIRDEIQRGNIILKYVPSGENMADIFTKPPTMNKLQKFKVCF